MGRKKIILVTIIIVGFVIFLISITNSTTFEKMQCISKGGWWDPMLDACGFDPKICQDAGGIPTQIFGKYGKTSSDPNSSVSILGCKFD